MRLKDDWLVNVGVVLFVLIVVGYRTHYFMSLYAEPTEKLLGETIGFWVQNLILLSSALGAFWTIRSSEDQAHRARKSGEDQARRATTVSVVMAQGSNLEIRNAVLEVLGRHDNGEKACPDLQHESPEYRQQVLISLSAVEFIAAGIRMSCFDEDTYKQMRYSNVIDTWNYSKAFVYEYRIRSERPTMYQDVEWLAERWVINPLLPDMISSQREGVSAATR